MKLVERIDLEEAVYAGLKGMNHLLQLVSSSSDDHSNVNPNQLDCTEITEFTVSKFKQVINLLDAHLPKPHNSPPSGNARGLRKPSLYQPEESNLIHHQPQTQSSVTQGLYTLDSANPVVVNSISNPCTELISVPQYSKSKDISVIFISSATSSVMAGDRNISDGNVDISMVVATQPISAGKHLPMPSYSGKRSPSDIHFDEYPCSETRAQPAIGRTIRVRIGDIDDRNSWRKYGQKFIKGLPNPRCYYRCSSVKGCPAKKRVQRAENDSNTLVITYHGDHCHPNA